MFPIPYPAPYAAILYVLFGLDLTLLFLGLALGRYNRRSMGRLALPVRMALSVILVLAALLHRQLARGPVAAGAAWISLGMALGFLGDLIMARLIRLPDRLIWGMLAFGLGHVAYTVALVAMAVGLGLWQPWLALAIWIATALVALGLWHRFVRSPGGDRIHNAGALGYSLLMATINAAAFSLAFQEARFIPLAAGALLFLTSDLIIGNWNIRGNAWKGVNDAVWITYNLGQALIVYSVAAAVNVALAA